VLGHDHAHFLGAPSAATNATAVNTFTAVMLRYPRIDTALSFRPPEARRVTPAISTFVNQM
jgi:hypothetical protein